MSDEDDYMTMTFGEDEDTSKRSRTQAETSLQRRKRLERQGRERGHRLSKAELAKAAETEREAALNRSLFDAQTGPSQPSASSKWPAAPRPAVKLPDMPVNKGLAMMAKMGFVAGQALGRKREVSVEKAGDGEPEARSEEDRPMIEPIRIHVKRGRAGLGATEEKEEKVSDQDGNGPDSKRLRLEDMDPLAYRDRLRQEREAGRLERQIHAAQVVAERMARGEEDDDQADEEEAVPIRDVNVLWRGMVKERRAKEYDRAQRIKAQKLLDARLRKMGRGMTIQQEVSDDDEDGDDRMASGKGSGQVSFLDRGMRGSIAAKQDEEDEIDESDEEAEQADGELNEFNALEPKERLQQVVDWMRQNRRYCFWCKSKYPDDELDGCPGPTEEDHD
ncbi:hypothetical protein SEPCBS119000_001851 [Sporothrix epigloea]|uniref:G-patch domain-containing protein n=1 Tax=Sporothrix epigloea TaxID=1892477 RepID=A0ABP0DG75_9PEZI